MQHLRGVIDLLRPGSCLWHLIVLVPFKLSIHLRSQRSGKLQVCLDPQLYRIITEIFQTHKKNTLSFMADHKRKGEKSLDMVVVPNQACS